MLLPSAILRLVRDDSRGFAEALNETVCILDECTELTDASFVPNGNTNAPIAEGMNGPEVSQRLNQLDEKYGADSELKSEVSHLPVASVPNIFGQASFRTVVPSDKPSLLGAPFRRDNSSFESDEVKRRFLIVNPSQEIRYQSSGEPPLLSRLPAQPPVIPIQPPVIPIQLHGVWLVEEDINRGRFSNRNSGTVQESDALKTDKQQAHHNLPFHGTPGSIPGLPSHISEVKGEEGYPVREAQRQNTPSAKPSGNEKL